MQIKRKLLREVKGSYSIVKRNIFTCKETKYEGTNIILDSFKSCLVNAYYGPWGSNQIQNFLAGTTLALGSGTTEPSSSDQQLTSYLFGSNTTTQSVTLENNGKTAVVTLQYTVNADASHVGTITEIGIVPRYQTSYGNRLMTKSLLKDAEGNPISIVKTDLDELIITYKIRIASNGIVGAYRYLNTLGAFRGNAGSYADITTAIYAHISPTIAHACYYNDNWRTFCFLGYRYVYDTGTSVVADADQVADAASKATYGNGLITLTPDRIPTSHKYNGHFINSLFLSSGTSKKQDTDIINLKDHMLVATLQNYSVGVGDGSEQDFVPPIPSWLKDTEKIYINGIEQTRNVDYTCDNTHNLQDNYELNLVGNALLISGELWNSSGYPSVPAIYGINTAYKNGGGGNQIVSNIARYILTVDTPYIIKLPDKSHFFDKQIDTIYIASSYHDSTVDASKYEEFTIEASNDLSTWNTILTDVTGCPSNVTIEQQPIYKTLDQWAKYTLQAPVYYTYWRISAKMLGGRNTYRYLGLRLDHDGAPIHFTSAPAQDAVITMDCNIDRPWKDDQHVLDLSVTWEA